MASDRDEIYGEPAQDGDRELAWLAFRYITGELAVAEAAEFEVRLESDQSAREAVAAMVELAAMVERAAAVEIASHAERMPAIEPASLHRAAAAQAAGQAAAAQAAGQYETHRSGAPRWKLPAGGVALATAASLAAVLVAYSLVGRNERPGSASDQHDSASLDRQLADAWAATVWRDGALVDRPLATDDERPPEFDLLAEDLAANTLEDDPLLAGGGSAVAAWESADGELMISDWLWEAVSGAQEGAPTEPDPRSNEGEG